MYYGKVKWYLEHKGYGVIQADQSGEEIFVFARGIVEGPLEMGKLVSYELIEDGPNPEAVDVRLVPQFF